MKAFPLERECGSVSVSHTYLPTDLVVRPFACPIFPCLHLVQVIK